MAMTKKKAKTLCKASTDADLARELGCSRQSVHKWGDDEAIIPRPREWQILARQRGRKRSK